MTRGQKSFWGRGVGLSIAALSSVVFAACGLGVQGISDSDGGASGARSGAQCRVDTDCPHASAPCVRAACMSGFCEEVLEAAGPSATIRQAPRDCHRLFCDGKGGTVDIADDADLPDDDNPCTEDTCHGGVAAHSLVARGVNVTGCTDDLACDGQGQCLTVNFAACEKAAECISGECFATSLLSSGVCRKAVGEACARGEECATNVCDASGQCAACDIHTCALGACFNGACFRKCTNQASCEGGYTCTPGGLCVNDCPNSPCKAGDVCVNAVCVPPKG